jgi:hypothetical protein
MLCEAEEYGDWGMGPRVTAGTFCGSGTVDSGYMFFGGRIWRRDGSAEGCIRGALFARV